MVELVLRRGLSLRRVSDRYPILHSRQDHQTASRDKTSTNQKPDLNFPETPN